MFRKLVNKKFGFLYILTYLMAFVVGATPTARALELVISENGSGSSNEVNTTVDQTTTVQQTNEASVANDVAVDSNTGGNEASSNTGGGVAIDTGNVSQNVSVETAVNSSIVDLGCCPEDSSAVISGNGSDSTNTIDINQTNTINLTTNQSATVTNNINGSANSGENTANNNTGGNVSIDTGNIWVTGGIVNGPINGSSINASAGAGGFLASISGNGAGSTNSINASFNNPTYASTDFFARIRNFVNWDLNTGRNSANGNTAGAVSITTGDIFFDFFIKNGPINFGLIDIDCCPIDPDDPGNGGPPPDGEEPPGGEEPPDGEDEENGDEDENGEDENGDDGDGVGGEVLGLGDTSGLANPLIFWAGIILFILGARYISNRRAYEKNHKTR